MGEAFRLCVRSYLKLPVQDTQCGFKLYHGDLARELIPAGKEPGWLSLIETLLLAQGQHKRIVEVPIAWHEVAGSKVHLLSDALIMLLGVSRLCLKK